MQQWRIQDFQDGGGGGYHPGAPTYLFWQYYPENWMKLEKIAPERGRVTSAPLDSPMYSKFN